MHKNKSYDCTPFIFNIGDVWLSFVNYIVLLLEIYIFIF